MQLIKSLKNFILTFFSRMHNLPTAVNVNSTLRLDLTDLDNAIRTSLTHASMVSRVKGLSLDK